MKMMFPIIASFSKDLVNLVDELSSNELGIDIKNVCTRFTADVIGSCGFGIDCNAMKDENSEMLKMGDFFDIRDLKTRMNFFFVNVFPEVAKKFKMKLTPDYMTEFFMRVIKQTYDFRQTNEVNRIDFMSLLMQIQKYGKLKDEESEVVGQMTFNEMAAQACKHGKYPIKNIVCDCSRFSHLFHSGI
jgi:cytochrome P450 family 6